MNVVRGVSSEGSGRLREFRRLRRRLDRLIAASVQHRYLVLLLTLLASLGGTIWRLLSGLPLFESALFGIGIGFGIEIEIEIELRQ